MSISIDSKPEHHNVCIVAKLSANHGHSLNSNFYFYDFRQAIPAPTKVKPALLSFIA